jgi:4,5-dihydroxyphthalate decarboxylase
MSEKLELTLAISDYDHVRDLVSGLVRPQGIELTCLQLPVEEIFFRFTAFREWHLSEMSMAKYSSLRAAGDDGITAIPVFPSRVFRHSSFFVRRDSDVREPEDLAGRRVGVPEWAQTAGVYARGVLMHEYGVGLDQVTWVQGGVNQPGRQEQAPLELPAGVEVTVDRERSLNDLLLAGELDAVISAHPPKDFRNGNGPIVHLMPDYVERERDWHARTGIFPIMHIIALRSDVFAEHPWAAMEMTKAFQTARDLSVARVGELTASRVPIPWSNVRAEEAREEFGELWPYGIESNRTTLDAFLGYCHEQGICSRRLAPEELVPAEVQTEFRI